MTEPEVLSYFKQSTLRTGKYDTYFDAYEELFSKYRNKPMTFVEVGVMGGGSLEAWKKYFGKDARIIGIDLNPQVKEYLEQKGYEVFIGDQADPRFWSEFYKTVGKIDVLLDDGGHTNTQTWVTLNSTIPHVRDGGMVVVEDTHASYMRGFGNPSKESFVSKAKACIDAIHFRSSRIGESDRKGIKITKSEEEIAKSAHSIQFFESLVAFSIDRRKCRKSETRSFGNLSEPQPEDFRTKGIQDSFSLAENIKNKIRSFLKI